MTVWVVTLEMAWAGYWRFQGVHSTLEGARAWVEAQRSPRIEPARWTILHEGALWLCDGYCVHRAVVDADDIAPSA